MDAPFWGPYVEYQRSGGVVSCLRHLGEGRQEVQVPVTQVGVQTPGPELNDELGWYYGDKVSAVVNEQHSYQMVRAVCGAIASSVDVDVLGRYQNCSESRVSGKLEVI